MTLYIATVKDKQDGSVSVIKSEYKQEWLLPIEIHEIASDTNLKSEIVSYLNDLVISSPHLTTLINEGIELNDK